MSTMSSLMYWPWLRFSQCSPPSVERIVPHLDRLRRIGLAGAAVEHQDALGRIGVGAAAWEAHTTGRRVQLAGVIAAVNLAILAPDQDHIGVMRMKQDRPYRQAVIGQFDLLPVLAAIRAAVHPGLGAGVDDLRLRRVHCQGAHGGALRQAALQRFPLVAAVG
jgi:hypothetical protein